MTIKKLSDLDFMMMDVHRPMLDEEINEVNPKARVDKSLRAVENIDSEAPRVDTPHPEPRCKICFGPVPCDQHANVASLDVVTSHDIPVAKILAGAHARDLDVVVVVGLAKDGNEYFASSCADGAEVIYHLTRGIFKMNMMVDQLRAEAVEDDDERA